MDELPKPKKAGIPGWVVTYADLMSLLMCFFVLLLSFAEIDADRFRRLAGELSKAFGVQREVPAEQIPMGTSPAFDKFSPGRPEPTPLNQVKQSTAEIRPRPETFRGTQESRQDRMLRAVAAKVGALLEASVTQGRMLVETERQRIVIRIQQQGTFPSGTARVLAPLRELLARMAVVFADIPGIVAVDGHTDSVPISDSRYASNWGLSAARASSVANALLDNPDLAPDRLMVRGFADTRPLDGSDTPEARARNRRVEITIDLAEASEAERDAVLQALSDHT